MHPSMQYALARANADEIVRRSEQNALRRAVSSRPQRPARSVAEHRYALPRVVEVPRGTRPETFDESVW